jgi:hypothetical protein
MNYACLSSGLSLRNIAACDASGKLKKVYSALPIWAGVVPVRLVASEVEPDARNLPGVQMPENVLPAYLRKRMGKG